MGFRAELLRDPKATIQGMFGIEMPGGMKVHAFELNPDDVMIALPRVDKADGELSDDDLESVAGGTGKSGQMSIAIPLGGATSTSQLGSLFMGAVATKFTGLSADTVKQGMGMVEQFSGKKIC